MLREKFETGPGFEPRTSRIPVQVRILLLKSKIVISKGTNYKFGSTYQFDFKIIKESMLLAKLIFVLPYL